jgi:peptide/nickel transport system substrate-binding protein
MEAQGLEEFGRSPVGSGSYQFDTWDEGQRVALTANEGYWGGVASSGTITFRLITEPATRLAELQTAWVGIIKSIPAENVSMVEEN